MLNKKKIKHIKSLSIATTWLVAVLFLSCQNNNIDKIRSFSHPPGSPSLVANDVELLFSDSAKINFMLNAPLVKIFDDVDDPYKEFPEGFVITQFNKNNDITSYIKADYGKYYEKKSIWEARQNVVAVTETNDSLLTDILFWDEEKNQIYSDQFVKFIQNEDIITGIGFESDLQMQRWKIKEIKGTILVEVEEEE
ncbi:MAG: LPS export ABC transporter periplasmic protein LptC [Prolixibacteraceae bacterium]|nr:LPS export ABC transporter periplasmic protein LptC [Prolixibacteraceae bacterium]